MFNISCTNQRVTALIVLIIAITCTTAICEQVLYSDGFETGLEKGWAISMETTETSNKIVPGGHLSNSCLQTSKPDYCGVYRLTRLVDVTQGQRISISADLNTALVGAFSEYFIEVRQLDAANGARKSGSAFAFNDGLSVSSEFGGSYKTPQTLGEWKTTRHIVDIGAGVSKIELSFVFRGGRQIVRLDNVEVRTEDAAVTAPDNRELPVYSRTIDSATALLDLDLLVPGYAYELTATTDTTDHRRFGAKTTSVDVQGKPGQTQTLLPVKDEANTLTFRFAVPDDAVQMRLDLFNDDPERLGPFQVSEYRKWGTISIRTLSTAPAPDTLFANYIHRLEKDPEITRPREMVTVTAFDRQCINADLSRRRALDGEVRKIGGGMAIVVGGKVVPPMSNAAFTQGRYDSYSQLVSKGIKLIRVENAKGPGFSGQWPADGRYDFSSTDEAMYRALKPNPDAAIILQVGCLYPPTWWGNAHPDEVLRDSNGLALSIFDQYSYGRMWGNMAGGELGRVHEARYADNSWLTDQGAKVNTTYFPSPASRIYRDDVKAYLAALRRHIEAQPYGNVVVGYALDWGYDMQWGWPVIGDVDEVIGQSNASRAPHDVDYSKPMLAYFRSFLKTQYRSVEELRKAWNDETVSFDTASIPLPAERFTPFSNNPTENKALKHLLDPATQRKVVDYSSCMARVVGDLLNEFGVALKASSPKKVFVQAYFQDALRDQGHNLVLNGSGLDISGGPDYACREVGQAGLNPHKNSSYLLHNKVAFTEVDHRLFSTLFRNYKSNQVFETPRKSISVLQREYARVMCNGGGAWTLDMGLGWYNQPILSDSMGAIYDVFARVIKHDRSSTARMAVFYSDYTYNALALPGHGSRNLLFETYTKVMLQSCGVPVDVYMLNDLPLVSSGYKVFVFPNAHALTDKDFRAIKGIKRNGNLLVFGPASGFQSDTQLSKERVERLTGMSMQQDDTIPWTTKFVDHTSTITQDAVGYMGFDEDDHARVAFPMFYVTDPAAVPLAEYVGAGSGRTGIAFKDNKTWQSVYIGAMSGITPELFRGFARQKGLHIYSTDGDVMFFDKSLVAIHASCDGTKTTVLPGACKVTSLWDNRYVGVTDRIVRDMKTGDNALYLLEPVKE